MIYNIQTILKENIPSISNRTIYVLPAPSNREETNQYKSPTTAPIAEEASLYTGLPTIASNKSILSTSDFFGALVADLIKFEAGRYPIITQSGAKEYVSYAETILPKTCVLEVSQTKNIVRSNLVGGKGTFQELTGEDDHTVIIRGVLLATDNEDMYAQISKLQQLYQVPAALSVVSEFLELFQISELIIESMSFPESRGTPLKRSFEINCYSSTTRLVVQKIEGL